MKQNKETHGQGAGGRRRSQCRCARSTENSSSLGTPVCFGKHSVALSAEQRLQRLARLLFRPLLQTSCSDLSLSLSLSLSSMSVPMSVPMSAHMSMVPTECTTTMGEGVTQLRTQGEGNQSRERQRGEKETIGIGINGAKVEPANERRLLAIPRVEYGVGWCCFRALRHVFVHSVMCGQAQTPPSAQQGAGRQRQAGEGHRQDCCSPLHQSGCELHLNTSGCPQHDLSFCRCTHDNTRQHTAAHDSTRHDTTPLHSAR